MNPILLAVYLGILCVALVVLLVYLIVRLVTYVKSRNTTFDESAVFVYNGKTYKLVPVGESAPAQPVAEPAVKEPAVEEAAPAAVEETEPAETPAEAPAETPFVLGEDKKIVDSNAVVLVRTERLKYADAYAALSSIQRGFADELIAYAEGKGETREVSAAYAVTIYYLTKPVLQVHIRRGTVFAKVYVPNTSVAEYAGVNNVSIKEKPIDVKIDAPEKVGRAKDLIDIARANIEEGRARRAQAVRERRRQKRLEKYAAQLKEDN